MVKYIHSDKWTAKQNYVEKIMRENSEVETLTEEQHEALQELARIRHEIHSSWETMWNDEASDNPRLWNYIESGIDEMLTEAELPTIEFSSRKRNRKSMTMIRGNGERKVVLSMSLQIS